MAYKDHIAPPRDDFIIVMTFGIVRLIKTCENLQESYYTAFVMNFDGVVREKIEPM